MKIRAGVTGILATIGWGIFGIPGMIVGLFSGWRATKWINKWWLNFIIYLLNHISRVLRKWLTKNSPFADSISTVSP